MACECIKEINRRIAPRDQYVRTSLEGAPGRAAILLMRRDERAPENRVNKPKVLIATFCPFCGTEYDETAGTTATRAADPAPDATDSAASVPAGDVRPGIETPRGEIR